jgi:hypothetical protein
MASIRANGIGRRPAISVRILKGASGRLRQSEATDLALSSLALSHAPLGVCRHTPGPGLSGERFDGNLKKCPHEPDAN